MRKMETYDLQVKTLTPLHIGDGNFLSPTEYATYKDGEDSYIAVVDPEKVLDIIGQSRLSAWVSAIENNIDMSQFMKPFAGGGQPKQYMKRAIKVIQGNTIQQGRTIKTCIHDGMGYPYLPGSSIKGAIRTIILAHCLQNTALYQRQIDDAIFKKKAADLENEIFGKMDKDIFHSFRCFDARFEKDTEVAYKEYNLNIRKSNPKLEDNSKAQWVEVIRKEKKTSLCIQVDIEGLKRCSNGNGTIKSILSSQESLFSVINGVTRELIETDIDFWQQEIYDGKDEDGVVDYIDCLEDIMQKVIDCTEGECVLRVGHGSGWRFMTGAWAELLEDNQWDKVMSMSRPKNERYEGYPFPKTRRVGYGCILTGFIKLSTKTK